MKTFFALIFLLAETVAAVALVCLLIVFLKFSSELQNLEIVATDIRPPVATTIVSQDGVVLGKLDVENRQPVPLNQVSKNLVNATIAVEDHRFYEHPGVDLQAIARAAWANIRGNRLSQGASTLTQQLVRNLDQFGLSNKKRFDRKIREALIALRMEQLYSKQEILQLYLNNTYYGAGAYGIQAASKTYFGKSADRLTLGEAALLAGIPQRPSYFSLFSHSKAALERRDEVLGNMLEYGYITQAQYEQAKSEPPRLMPRPEHKQYDLKAPYFVYWVLKQLTDEYGWDYVQSGLKIETTLNWKMQQMAEKALYDGLDNSGSFGANQGALISIENQTGHVRAMVGGRSFHASQFNIVTQGKRQPGSTFKVFDYTAAFDTGHASLNKTYEDVPIPYPHDPKHRVVKNYGGGYSFSAMDCLSAIQWSRNTIAVQAAQDVGIRKVIEYAHRMGITTKLAPYLPTALGASAVRPIDLCTAYTVFPMKGSRALPMGIVRITDADNNVIKQYDPVIKDTGLKADTVDQMNRALEAVVNGGTGARARGYEEIGIVEGAHGKTGTTSDNRDAWFAGYTPELCTVLWVASVHRGKNNRPEYLTMPNATGGGLCAPIWHNYMIQAVPIQRKIQQDRELAALGPAPPPVPEPKPDKPKPDTATTKLASDVRERPARHRESSEQHAAPSPNAPAPETTMPSDTDSGDVSASDQPGEPPPMRGNRIAVPSTEENSTPVAPVNSGEKTRISTAAAPLPRPAPPPEMVTVHICVDSGALANDYCPAYKTVRMTAAEAKRLRPCRMHKPPAGEE
jgi:penicillin-binding protein 1A